MRRTACLALALVVASSLAGCGLTGLQKPAESTGSAPMATLQQGPPLRQVTPTVAAEACVATARELVRAGREREAVAQYERARQHLPQIAGAAHPLAVLYDRLGQTEKAREEYRRALGETPNDPDLLNDFGCFNLHRGKLVEAEEPLRRAVQADSRHKRAAVNLGLTLAAQGRHDEALAVFEAAVGPAAAQSNLGVVYAQNQEFVRARRAFERARALDPTLPQPNELLEWLDAHPELSRAGHAGVAPAPAPSP